MPVVRAQEIRRFEVDGICVSGLATALHGAVEVMLWRNRIEPGSAFPAASRDHEEVVVVLSGYGTLNERDLALPFSAGDVLIVPAGALCQIVPAEDGQPFECDGYAARDPSLHVCGRRHADSVDRLARKERDEKAS